MAKEKTAKGSPDKEAKEITFTCRFCGEVKPISEMILETRFFPVLTSCRACDRALQSIKREELPEESATASPEAAEATEETADKTDAG